MATLVELVKKGVIPKEVEFCAKYEKRSVDYIVNGLIEGTIVIPANVYHRQREDFTPRAIGKGLKTKVNANIGTSGDIESIELELEKLKVAVKYGADAVMDLSTGKFIDQTRKAIVESSPLMVGTVPIYRQQRRLPRNTAL